jgi:hypothetical protein
VLASSTGDDATLPLVSTASAGLAPATGTPVGNYLKDDGTWASVSAAPGGSDTQIQFNDGGAFGGDVDLTYNKSTNALSVGRIYTLSSGLMLGSATQGPTLTASSNSANASVTLSSNAAGSGGAGGAVVLEGGSNVTGGTILQVHRKGDAAGSAFSIANGNAASFGSNIAVNGSINTSNFTFYVQSTQVNLGSNSHLTWTANSNSTVSIDVGLQRIAAGVLKITNGSTGGGIVELPQVAAGGTPTSNSARIYSKDVSGTAEVFVMDEAGNETQISPHNTSAPESFVDSAFDEIGYTANYYTGLITYTNKQRQIAGRPDSQFIETFEEHNARAGQSLIRWDWATIQAEQVAQRNYDRAEWAKRKTEWELNPENAEKPFAEQEPEVLTAKPQPQWLTDQLAERDEFLSARPIGAAPQWLKFGAILAQDALTNSFFLTLNQQAPILDRMLSIGLGQASQGNFNTFLEAWAMGRTMGIISDQIQQHIISLTINCNLPEKFISGLSVADQE